MTLLHDCAAQRIGGGTTPRTWFKVSGRWTRLVHRRDGGKGRVPVWAVALFCLLASAAVTFAIDRWLHPDPLDELPTPAGQPPTGAASPDKRAIPPGMRAPDFTLQRVTDGPPIQLSKLAGKPVVLMLSSFS
jgi:hypothetical protein